VRIGRIPLGQRELLSDLVGLANGEHGGRLLRIFATRFIAAAGGRLENLLFSDELSSPPRADFRPIHVVLYRQQIPSEEFPEVTGDVIQVSPLLREIATWTLPNQDGFELLDPTIALTLHLSSVDPEVGVSRSPGLDVHLLDLHPVVRGASYRYWLVRFTPQGEPDQTIPAGELTLPL
jgi:hypothetical protein